MKALFAMLFLLPNVAFAQMGIAMALPSDPGPFPQYALVYGYWFSPSVIYGNGQMDGTRWVTEAILFDNEEEAAEHLMDPPWSNKDKKILGLWRLEQEHTIPQTLWDTSREIEQKFEVRSYTEKTQHIRIGDREYEGEPTGKPYNWEHSDTEWTIDVTDGTGLIVFP